MKSGRLVLLLGLVSLLIAACAPAARTPLEEARIRWDAQDLENYSFTLRRNCFCPIRGPVIVEVRDGETVSVVQAETGESEQDGFDLLEVFDGATTVDGLFDIIDEAEGAARLDVEYHPDMGYPTYIYIDESEMIADEEMGYEVEDLTPLN